MLVSERSGLSLIGSREVHLSCRLESSRAWSQVPR